MVNKNLTFLFKISLLSFATILSFTVAELLSRFFLEEPVSGNELIEKSNNPIISYQLKANTIKKIRNPDGTNIEYSINNQGFRGKTYKPNSNLPILFLGDSVMFGWGVDEQRMFSTQVEKFLRDKYEIKSHSINLGVNGYSIDQYLEIYKIKSQYFSPSIVVLGLTLNDANPFWDLVYDDLRDKLKFKIQNAQVQETNQGPLGGRFPWARFLDKIHMYRAGIKPIIQRIVDSQHEIDIKDSTYLNDEKAYFDENIDDGWGNRKTKILRLKNLAESNGQDFLLIIFPYASQLNSNEIRTPQNKIIKFALENKIKYIDFLPLFSESSLTTADLFLDSVHLSEDGNNLIASYVSRYIAECILNSN